MTFDEAYARHRSGDTSHHVCSECFRAGWEAAILAERERCAKVAEMRAAVYGKNLDEGDCTMSLMEECEDIAAAIRKRD